MLDTIIQNNFESILESIEIIQERFDDIKNPDDFMTTPSGVTKLDSITMRLQNIGELLKKIDKREPNYLFQFKEIDWEKIIKLRDLISHHYHIINPIIIYDICKKHIPKLKTVVEKILKT